MASVKKTKYRTAIVFHSESELDLEAFTNAVVRILFSSKEVVPTIKTFQVEEIDYPEVKVGD